MSWHFLQEQEEASWEESSLDGAPSALLKLIPSAEKSCSHDNETGASNGSPSGMTLRRLTGPDGEVTLMWFQGDSPVRTYHQREKVRVSRGSGQACGPKWPGSWARYSPSLYSWRTRRCSLFEDFIEFLGTWPRWGMMQDGECWVRVMLGLPTCENVFGLLPTPNHIAMINMWASAEYKVQLPLRFDCHTYGERESGAKVGSNLSWTVAEWHLRNGGQRDTELILDPCLYEMMMDWPMGWTDLDAVEMDKFQQWLDSHGKS